MGEANDDNNMGDGKMNIREKVFMVRVKFIDPDQPYMVCEEVITRKICLVKNVSEKIDEVDVGQLWMAVLRHDEPNKTLVELSERLVRAEELEDGWYEWQHAKRKQGFD